MTILIIHRTYFTKTTLNQPGWLRTTAAAVLSHTSLCCHFTRQRCSLTSKAGKNSSSSRHRDLAAAKTFDLFLAWTRASFCTAGQCTSEILISWCCHPARAAVVVPPVKHATAGQKTAMLLWTGVSMQSQHFTARSLARVLVEASDAALIYSSYNLGLLDKMQRISSL